MNGARQVGKTSLVRAHRYAGAVDFATLDDPATRAGASFDPRAFVDRTADTFVVDEAQLEPALFRAVKAAVDRDRRPGRFLLTGSSRLMAAPEMADSLVGRVETLELWPFSERELVRNGSADSFVDVAFSSPQALMRSGETSRRDYAEMVVRGGFPEVLQRTHARRARWFDSYVQTVTQRVVHELADIERLAEIPRLLRLCAARSGTELNITSIASDLGIPARTLSSYMAHLSNAFLVHLIPAWSTNLSAKVVRRPKIVVTDTGLAAHLNGVTAASLLSRPDVLGPLLETFVAMELRKQLSWSAERAALWHFRDRSGAEVDLVIEHPDGRIVGIEVKATSSPRVADARGLRFLADRLGDRFWHGFLLSTAPDATPLGSRVAALPISSLWASP